jgi:hypothetical protein
MRKLILLLGLGLGLLSSRLAVNCQAQPSVTVAWNAVTNPFVSGYYLAWGPTSNGPYVGTNTYPSNQTSGTISNLSFTSTYYIGVATFSTNYAFTPNPLSPYSSSITYVTNALAVVITPNNTGNGPPLPPLPPGATKPEGTKVGTGNNNNAAISPTPLSFTNITQVQIPGIPPLLAGFVTNSSNFLTIQGTVGAHYEVQISSNGVTWSNYTNVTMTTPAVTNELSSQPQNAIDLAFVPSVLTIPVQALVPMTFYQVMMPYDYAILAGMVLTNQGYSTRLILVDLADGVTDDCCYVSQAGSFIHYGMISNQLTAMPNSSLMQLEGSGSTIRQIATTLANNLNLDWIYASEFTYSSGNANILATVVEADPAAMDPVAGTNVISTTNNINF